MTWTREHLDRLKSEGKIRGFSLPKKKEEKTAAGRIVAKHFKKKSNEKNWISEQLFEWSRLQQKPLFEEYTFDSTGERKFRFDWCFPDPRTKIAIEYEGIFNGKSRHTSVIGYTNDTIKYNLAQAQGWRVIRLTAMNYKSLITELNKLL